MCTTIATKSRRIKSPADQHNLVFQGSSRHQIPHPSEQCVYDIKSLSRETEEVEVFGIVLVQFLWLLDTMSKRHMRLNL